MPRRARSLQHGDFYHVINRGSARARLFYDAKDYDAFIRLLDDTVTQFDLDLFSYCLMPNHWHLVVQPVSHSQLSRSMHWLTCTHAIRWCRVHERRGPGPLYQGRYKSIPVEHGDALTRVCRYVERNAKAKRLVVQAEEWRWSSANQRLRNSAAPPLKTLPFLIDSDWTRTINLSSDDKRLAEAIRKSRPYGSDDWTRNRLKYLGLSESGLRGRPKNQKIDPSLL